MRRLAKILISVLGNHLKSMDEYAVNRPLELFAAI
jgi:hypothetical protein